MINNLQNLIRIISSLAESAYNDGWLSIEYIAGEELPFFMSEGLRVDAELLSKIPILVQGIEQLLSRLDTAGLDLFLQESITGDETQEELLAAVFLRCVAERRSSAETAKRLKRIID